MTDISVQPVRTFWHGELKTKRSRAFDVESGAANELKALGLVEIKGDAAPAKPEVVSEAVIEPVVEPVADPAPKKKAKPNADDKDS